MHNHPLSPPFKGTPINVEAIKSKISIGPAIFSFVKIIVIKLELIYCKSMINKALNLKLGNRVLRF